MMKKVYGKKFLAACLALFALHAQASELKAPQTIQYGEKAYALTSKYYIGERVFYKYTADSASNSTVIIQFAPNVKLSDWAWARDVRAYLESIKPRPYYDISHIGGKPITRFLTMPESDGKGFESNTMLFYPDACEGQVVFQYVEKIDQAGNDVKSAWAKNNEHASNLIRQLDWQPECSATPAN